MVAQGAALLSTLTRSVASVVTATREEGSFARLETTSVIVVVLATFQRCVEPRVNHQRRRKQLVKIPRRVRLLIKLTPQQVEAAWGYPDGNWACQVDLEKRFELPGSINFIENKDPSFTPMTLVWTQGLQFRH